MDSDHLLRDDGSAPLNEDLVRLYSQGFLTDITLSTEDGKNFEAHRIILSARSLYFHSLVPRLKSDAVIFLKGVKGAHLDKVLKFIYGGSVSVSKHQVKPVLEVARSLQVKGLRDVLPSEVHKIPPNKPFRKSDKTTSTPYKTSRTPTKANGRPNGGLQDDSDSDDGSKQQEDKGEEESDDITEPLSPPKPKRKRGRPPKNPPASVKEEKRKENSGTDPYDFDDDDEELGSKRSGEPKANTSNGSSWRSKKAKRKNDELNDKETPEEESDLNNSKKEKKAQNLNNRQVLVVKCKGQLAELHINRFASGVKGLSIKYKESWMTPQNFEVMCGSNTKNYLENIQTDYGPLKALTASGMLKPHSRKCRCSLCRGEDPPPPPSPEKPDEEEAEEDEPGNPNPATTEASTGIEEEEDEDDDEDEEDDDDEEEEDDDEDEEDDEDDEDEKRRMKKREDWSRTLETKLKSEYDDTPPQILPQVSCHQQQLSHHIPNSVGSYISLLDHPPKISPSIIPQQTGQIHQPERMDTPQTLFLMSSPHISAPHTPQHNPFSNISGNHQPLTTLNVHHGGQLAALRSAAPQSRIGSVMQVRCKSTTALLYANKYESGSKGKCIQLGDEWLTPNEFEDRAGSKAKKYLSSIKCLGRPLRIYVQSGELRGTGPPPTPRTPKDSKHKIPTPIAPAPGPNGIVQSQPHPNQLATGPIPHNLNAAAMMMTSSGQPPILINQTTSMNSSIIGGNPSLMPMTVTLAAPPFEVRQ